jgi:hypothetical protein
MLFNDEETQVLVKSLFDQELEKLVRLAQSPNLAAGEQMLQGIARKLLNALPESSIYSDRPDAEVFIKDLASLDSLLSFLQTKEVKFNGARIVYPGGAGQGLEELPSDRVKAEYLPYPKTGQPQYYIDPAGLIAYIHDLGSKMEDNKFGQARLTAIGQEIESKLNFVVPPPGASEVKYPTTEEQHQQEMKGLEKKPDEVSPGAPGAPGAPFDSSKAVPVSYQQSGAQQQQQEAKLQGVIQQLNQFPLNRNWVDLGRIASWAENWMSYVRELKLPIDTNEIENQVLAPINQLVNTYKVKQIMLSSPDTTAAGLPATVRRSMGGYVANSNYAASKFIGGVLEVMYPISAMLNNVALAMQGMAKDMQEDLNKQIGQGYSILQGNIESLQEIKRLVDRGAH